MSGIRFGERGKGKGERGKGKRGKGERGKVSNRSFTPYLLTFFQTTREVHTAYPNPIVRVPISPCPHISVSPCLRVSVSSCPHISLQPLEFMKMIGNGSSNGVVIDFYIT
ncbi:MAG: hypothetical protein FWK04_01945 [Nostoc sp. GBBB01]|nr:hypothetical protein [Nostoc sp. GBBB01]